MYKKGMLKITAPPCQTCDENLYCDDAYTEGHTHHVYDTPGKRDWHGDTAYLPHSCDYWVIGGAKEISQMIEDLQEVLRCLTRCPNGRKRNQR